MELGRREERMIVKTLAQLATAEPGDNLPTVAFRCALVYYPCSRQYLCYGSVLWLT